VGQTPNNYLFQYRIQKSREMLRETKRPICEIAFACGFQTASYFSYVFRKEMGIIPRTFVSNPRIFPCSNNKLTKTAGERNHSNAVHHYYFAAASSL